MKIGILTAGGPAPGFNGVIRAVHTAALERGWETVGLRRGYEGLRDLDTLDLTTVDLDEAAKHGGSILGTRRYNPTKDPAEMARVVEQVKTLGLDALVTIGGDDTATTAAAIAAEAGTGLRVAHVPKTIDNDLPLPEGAPTFGFETAKDLGARLCSYLRTDAETTGRWYLVSAMGRSAGHLALGMGDGSDADLILIPEEFEDGVPFDRVVDAVEHAIAMRREGGQDFGLVVLGEGILDRLDKDDLARIASLELDEHGNPRMSEVDLGRAVRDALKPRLEEAGHKVGFVTKLIGYELRCADPVRFDREYTHTLGTGAVSFLADGDGDGIITVQGGNVVPLRFDDLRDPETGRIPVRRVDLDSAVWKESLSRQAR